MDDERAKSKTLSEQLVAAQALADQLPALREEVRDIKKLRADNLQMIAKLERSEGVMQELRDVAVAERAISDGPGSHKIKRR